MLVKSLKGAFTLNRIFLICLTLLGISHLTTQLIVIREFLNIFEGNELTIGFVLFSWLFLMGLGSFFGKYFEKFKRKIFIFALLQILCVLLSLLQIFGIRYIRKYVLPGISLNVNYAIFLPLAFLFPYCFLSGILLVLACLILGKKNIGIVYSLDNIGDILGSLLFSFFLIHFLNHSQIVLIIGILNFFFLFLLLRRTFLKYLPIFLSILFLILLFTNIDLLTLRFEYPSQKILHYKETPFGRFVVTKYKDQLNYFENGLLLFSSNQTQEKEEIIHYGLCQLEKVNSVLLIAGGIISTIEEIQKYNPKEIDYVELDPYILEYGLKNGLIKNSRIFPIDGRKFVDQTNKKYDAIIVDLSFPSSIQINRFFTLEFFRIVKQKLNERGVFVIGLVSSENYLSDTLVLLHSSVLNSLEKVFKNVLVVPGEIAYLIASDSNLTKDISNCLIQKNITTKYVGYYSKYKLSDERIKFYFSQLKDKIINKDHRPITYFLSIKMWCEKFGFKIEDFWLLIFAFIILFSFFYIFKKDFIGFSIFTTGFLAISIQNVLILLFQIFFGYVYQQIGGLIAFFMIGLSIFSYFFSKRKVSIKHFLLLEFFLMVYCFSLAFITNLKFNEAFFYILSFISGSFVGSEFAVASKIKREKSSKIASLLYSSDFIGSSFGCLISTIFLIPILGISKTLIFLGFLNLISLIFLITR